jgi:hypothetical protein
MSNDLTYPKPDSHNSARNWIAERENEYFTQSELKLKAVEASVSYLFSSAKAIYKPSGSPYAFSIRHEPSGPYSDQQPEFLGKTWVLEYAAEIDGRTKTFAASSTEALKRCMRDKMPIAVFWKYRDSVSPSGAPTYRNFGLGLPLAFEKGAFLIAGPYEHFLYSNDASGANSSFQTLLASTDALTTSLRRLEQSQLRANLLSGDKSGQCRMCGTILPASLLVASHIKPRSLCAGGERLHPHVATLMCLLGCDALFERGFIRVRDDGAIYKMNPIGSADLASVLTQFDERKIEFKSEEESSFFRFHRELLFED